MMRRLVRQIRFHDTGRCLAAPGAEVELVACANGASQEQLWVEALAKDGYSTLRRLGGPNTLHVDADNTLSVVPYDRADFGRYEWKTIARR